MAGGRPRTTTPPPKECIELGKKLVKWATEKTPEDEPLRCRFCEWYTLPAIGMIRAEWKLLIQVEEFWPYYEQAQAALGRRLIDGTINPSIGHRFMWHYVPEAKEQEIDKMEAQARIMKANESVTPQKVIFEVNYKNDGNNSVSIPPSLIPNSDTPSPE
jgi:hypothetical protein